MAEFMPQSLKVEISVGAVKATLYRPYSPSTSIKATIIVPTAETTVEIIRPHIRWNPPATEVFAKSVILLKLSAPLTLCN